MDYNLQRLCNKIASMKGDKISQGRLSGEYVIVAGSSYRAEFAAEIADPYDGKWVSCVISRGKAVVIGE